MKRLILGFLSLLTIGQFAMVALPAGAQGFDPSTGNALGGLEATNLGNGQGAGQAGAQLPILVGKIIRTILGLLGIIFVVLMVYASFLCMMARGEEEPLSKAKDIIKQAIIGVIIVFLAYALTGFVISSITKATTGQ